MYIARDIENTQIELLINNTEDTGVASLWLPVRLPFGRIERGETEEGSEIKALSSIRSQTLEAYRLVLAALVVHIFFVGILVANSCHETDNLVISIEEEKFKAAAFHTTFRTALKAEAETLLGSSRRFRRCERSDVCCPPIAEHRTMMTVQFPTAPPLIDACVATAIVAVEEIKAPHIEFASALAQRNSCRTGTFGITCHDAQKPAIPTSVAELKINLPSTALTWHEERRCTWVVALVTSIAALQHGNVVSLYKVHITLRRKNSDRFGMMITFLHAGQRNNILHLRQWREGTRPASPPLRNAAQRRSPMVGTIR